MTKALNLGYVLAEFAIKDYFSRTTVTDNAEAEMMQYCRERYSPLHAQRLAFRLQRRRLIHIVVQSVLASLPKIHRDVIIRKYRKREMAAKISMDLNISVARITSVERSVQDNIAHMLKYTLTVQDVYSRIKVVNMIHIVDLRLAFLEEHPEILPDVNRDWLTSLRICREKYRRLYSAMQEIMRKSESSIHCNIIAERLRNPFLTSKDLSAVCHVSQNGVNRHLRTYEEEMSKYLVA